AIDDAVSGSEIDGRWFACDDAGDRFGIFGGGEFAVGILQRGHDVSCPYGCRSRRSSSVQPNDDIAFVAEGDLEDAGSVVENAEDSDYWRRVNEFAEGFVVEADVAASDGRAKSGASFGEAVDGFAELPHHFGLL